MATYQITNRTSGQDLSCYDGATPEAAIRAMLADAGCTDEPDPALRAVEVARAQEVYGIEVIERRDDKVVACQQEERGRFLVAAVALDELVPVVGEHDDGCIAYERWCDAWGCEAVDDLADVEVEDAGRMSDAECVVWAAEVPGRRVNRHPDGTVESISASPAEW